MPCGPINNLEQVFDDPHIQARGVRQEVNHPAAGPLPTVANPIRFSESTIDYDRAPPLLGQHNVDVLQNLLGIDETTLSKLKDDGIV